MPVRIEANQRLKYGADDLERKGDHSDLRKSEFKGLFEQRIERGDQGLEDVIEQVRGHQSPENGVSENRRDGPDLGSDGEGEDTHEGLGLIKKPYFLSAAGRRINYFRLSTLPLPTRIPVGNWPERLVNQGTLGGHDEGTYDH